MVNDLGTVLGQNKKRLDGTVEQLGAIDTATYFEVPQDIVLADIADIRFDTTDVIGSTLIWGNGSVGFWGSYEWGDSHTNDPVRVFESRIYIDYEEDFTTTTKESSSSTVLGWGTGSIVFNTYNSYDLSSGSFSDVTVSNGSITFGD